MGFRADVAGDGSVNILTLCLNPSNEDRRFRLPPPVLPARVLIDSARPDVTEEPVVDNQVDVLAHGAVLVAAHYAAKPP